MVVAALLTACALGAPGLNADTIWTDEFYSLRDAGLAERETGERLTTPSNVAEIWNRVASGNPWHTPAFFVMLSGWARLVGFDPAVLRVLALFSGLLTIACTYRLGRILLTARVGAFAAVVLATSAYFVYYFHEIRMYTVVTMLTTLLFWLYFSIVSRQGRVSFASYLALSGVGSVFMYTHYFAALPLGALALFHLFFGTHMMRRHGTSAGRWWAVVLALSISVLVFLPWVRVLFEGINRTLDDEVLHSLALDNFAALEWMLRLFSNGAWWLLAIIVVFAVVAAVKHVAVRNLFAICLSLVLMILLVNQLLELFKPSRIRYMIILWPLLAIVVAVGIDQLRRWRGASTLFLSVWVAFTATGSAVPAFFTGVDSASYVYPLHVVAHHVRERAQPGDYVLSYVPEDLRVARYDRLANYYFAGIVENHRNLSMIYDDPVLADALHAEAVTSLGGAERVWLGFMPANVPSEFAAFRTVMEAHYNLCAVTRDDNQLDIALYARSPVCCIPDAAAPAPSLQFGDWFTVNGSVAYQTMDRTALDVVISWGQAPGAPLHRYSASVQLFDADGAHVAQADYGLLPATHVCQRVTLNVGDLPPGTYEARLAVYNWETGARLPATDVHTGAVADLLPFASVAIES